MSFLPLQIWQIWAIAAVLLVIGEVFTPGFVLACFSIACIPPAIMTFFGEFSFQSQMIAFAVSATAVFFSLRPVVLRYFSSRESEMPSNAEALVGQTGIVVKTISSDGISGGYVKVAGKEWWAFDPEGNEVPVGTRVVVMKVRGASIEVRPEGEETPSEE